MATVEQLVPAHYASRSQNDIDRSAHSQSKVSQLSVVLRSFYNDVLAAKNNERQTTQQPANLVELLVELAALKHFRKHEIADRKFLRIKQAFEAIRLCSLSSTKVVDPHT